MRTVSEDVERPLFPNEQLERALDAILLSGSQAGTISELLSILLFNQGWYTSDRLYSLIEELYQVLTSPAWQV